VLLIKKAEYKTQWIITFRLRGMGMKTKNATIRRSRITMQKSTPRSSRRKCWSEKNGSLELIHVGSTLIVDKNTDTGRLPYTVQRPKLRIPR
jgi:hypothetical protein